MIWVIGGIGYLIAVATIVRFFQFVSESDRSIEEFWVSKNTMEQKSKRELGFTSSSKKSARNRRRITRVSDPQRA